MPNDHFDPPVFEIAKAEKQVDISKTPFLYNEDGKPTYVEAPPKDVTLLEPAATNPAVAMGNEYVVSEVVGIKKTPPYGIETQLGFIADEVVYEPMWATRAVAAAFGTTLVERGQAVRLSSPVAKLSQIEYEYGVFAGHWSPYQEKSNKLITFVITDLEHHDFPHVFASTDSNLPLVISVGRYWPALNKIRLADLWVPRGSALYIPPKPAVPGQECVDLHNNRNSARACWGRLDRNTLMTDTLLQAEHGFFFWFWNATPTVHTGLIPKDQK
jgi:hypothetical protein